MYSTSKKAVLLVVDDEINFHKMLKFAFQGKYEIVSAQDMSTVAPLVKQKMVDLILLDLKLKKDTDFHAGLKRIVGLKKDYPNIPLLIVTNNGKTETIVTAMKNGADDFLYKGDFDRIKWQSKFEKHLKPLYLERENERLETQKAQLEATVNSLNSNHPFLGRSEKILKIKEELSFVATAEKNTTVLITGETGVGKEVAARYLHARGIRSHQPFVAVNLSTIQSTLVESTLFGHQKGAFTDAKSDRKGFFHQAEGGILFLDEIGDISLGMQVKLLRFIQDKTFRIVGSEKDITLDVQIVAATNKDLKKAIEEGTFRADFYQRLKVFPVHIPPLRKRREDIPEMIAHFMQIDESDLEKQVEKNTLYKLIHYRWEGNVRELKNTIEYMTIRKRLKKKEVLDLECLPDEIVQSPKPENFSNAESKFGALAHRERLALVDLQSIERTLQECLDRKGLAAAKLNTNADGLRYKVKKYYSNYPYLFEELDHIKRAYNI
ncbi:MAG: sigma-54 dependent transcriptional regulator [Bacteroidota bacterium]